MGVLLDEEEGRALLVYLDENLENLLHDPGREPERRFIDHHYTTFRGSNDYPR